MIFPERILLIEDSAVDVFIHRKVIEQMNESAQIQVCGTAMEALAYLQNCELENLPDIIFLDIRMPDLDGFDFLERLDQLPSDLTSKLKIIMLSSSIDDKDLKRARTNNYVLAFVPKPLTRLKLVELFD